MLTILIIIGLTILFMPVLLWLDRNSIDSDEFQSVEDWHNFRKTLGKK